MKEILFVDGYKIINACFKLNSPYDYELETARIKLLEILSQYQAVIDIKIIVVFDAYKVKGGREFRDKVDGIDVVFTKEGETADNFIERCIASYKDEFRVRVATSDWMEQQIIFAQGAERITPRELKNEIVEMFNTIEKYRENTFKRKQPLELRLSTKVKEALEEWRKKHD